MLGILSPLMAVFFYKEGLVYVHYGQEAHYDYLAGKGIDVANKIVLARYGGTFRGNIVNE